MNFKCTTKKIDLEDVDNISKISPKYKSEKMNHQNEYFYFGKYILLIFILCTFYLSGILNALLQNQNKNSFICPANGDICVSQQPNDSSFEQ